MPPLPPPITRKSHSLVTGAMLEVEEENWRLITANLVVAERVAIYLNGAKEDSLNEMVNSKLRSEQNVATVLRRYLRNYQMY